MDLKGTGIIVIGLLVALLSYGIAYLLGVEPEQVANFLADLVTTVHKE